MREGKFVAFLFLISSFVYCQEKKIKYNDDGLTRLTFGIHKTFYNQATLHRANEETGNIGGFNISNSSGFFINYKVLKYKNHSLKAGLFLNSLKHQIYFNGAITDVRTDQIRDVLTFPNSLKETSLEYCIDYSYLFKLNKNWFLDLSVGISQERNTTLSTYHSDYVFSDENLVPYQTAVQSIYFYKRKFLRYNYAASIGYKTNAGLVNLGVKYSLPEAEVAYGQYEFFEPGVAESDQGFGVFNFSGKYMSFTLSFTPSKDIFKKKK